MDKFFMHFGINAAWMWLFQIISFLLGLLLGYLLWGRLVKGLRASLAAMTQERDTLQVELNQLKEKYAALEAELERVNGDLDASTLRVRSLENEKGQLYGDLMVSREETEKATALLGERDNEILGFKSQLEGGISPDMSAELSQLMEDNKSLSASLESTKAALEACEAAKNTGTGLGIADVGAGVGIGTGIIAGSGDGSNKVLLQVIEGIGPKLEAVLLDGGIEDYAHLAEMDVDQLVNFFNDAGHKGIKANDIQEWQHQAGMAAAGNWGELRNYQLGFGGGNSAKVDKFATELGIAGLLSTEEEDDNSDHTPSVEQEVSSEGENTTTSADPDNLQIIEGIGPKMEEVLFSNGIDTYAKLEATDEDELRRIFAAAGFKPSDNDFGIWKAQAGMAANGDWNDLYDFQLTCGGGNRAKMVKYADELGITIPEKPVEAEDTSVDTEVDAAEEVENAEEILPLAGTRMDTTEEVEEIPVFTGTPDKLQALEGIGPKMEELLNKNGVYTFEALANANLQALFAKEGYELEADELAAWQTQAQMATEGKWLDLRAFQLGHGGGSRAKIDKYAKKLGIAGIYAEAEAAKQEETSTEDEVLPLTGARMDATEEKVEIPVFTGTPDSLQALEGIGPKMEELLNKNGVYTFEALANADLQAIFEREGYQMEADELAAWQAQAKLATDGQWADLRTFQLGHGGGSIAKLDKFADRLGIADQLAEPEPEVVVEETAAVEEDSGSSFVVVDPKLQALEGIGTKMEEILNKNGIHSYEDLANADIEKLKKMLKRAGYRTSRAELENWQKQAAMASKGQWWTLREFQLGNGGGNRAKIDKFAEEMGITHLLVSNSTDSMQRGMATPPQNLQVLEGIGPKMEQLLNTNGIKTYAELAAKSSEELDTMIAEAGLNPGISDTKAWVAQARLATAEKWQELHDLQLDEGGGSIAKIDKFEKKLGITLFHKEREADNPAPKPKKAKPLTKAEKEARSKEAAEKLKASMGSRIATASAEDKDDLKIISGVGPFIEEKLNKLGIYTFEQVSQFDDELIDTVTDAIQFFPGRIKRDNWVAQAAKFHQQKQENPEAFAKKANKKKGPRAEDLKIIEGIGPKIEGLLKADGIANWSDLAAASVDTLKAILKKAGDRYNVHNPSSWPQQADLAAKGEWNQLKQLQDELIGGRAPDKKS